jgi:hypothetical protein
MQTTGSRYGTLGILWVLYGIICIGKSAWIAVYNTTLTLMWGAIINRVADPFFWMSAFHIWLVGAAVVLVLAAIFSFLAAASLMRGRGNGGALALIASVLAILTGPLGVALGAYTMVVTIPRSTDPSRADYASAA